MATALNISLSSSDVNFVDSCGKQEEMSAAARQQFDELDAAMRKSATDFTRLAYKYGEASIRRLTCKDFGPWQDYLAALSALGAAGKAVKSLAMSVARFTFGGRVPNAKSGGWYFRPTSTFLVNFTVDKATVWDFANLPDLGKRLQEAAAFAKEHKGKLFTLPLTKEPVKKSPIEGLLDAALKIELVKAGASQEDADKKDKAAAKRIDNAFAELAAKSGIDLQDLQAACKLLAVAHTRAMKADADKAKASSK